jgi:hypothetical protein
MDCTLLRELGRRISEGPGMIVSGHTIRLIGSESAFYVGVFLGNWLFFFCIIKAALALRNRIRSL